jgi:proline dehydrogenase
MISFDNTEIAFKSKSNSDLNKSYFLFNLIKRPSIVKIGSSLTEFAFNFKLPINGIVKATIFKQFCGGENIEECTETINKLSSYGIGAILDYSVEGKENESEFEKTKNETLNTIKKATQSANIPFCVFKVTGLSKFELLEKISLNKDLSEQEKTEKDNIWQRVDSICKCAYDNSVPIFIDAEESWIQPAIDELADTMMGKYNLKSAIVYNTFQLYRNDRLDFLNSSIDKAKKNKYFLGAKLVRGAYMEKERDRAQKLNYPSPINPTKDATDIMYDNALNLCLDNINTVSICAGTHNEKSSLTLVELMEKKSISKNDKRVYFSQLFGMSEHISFNLAQAGYNVAKYLPYGPVKDVLPYLIRRAQENTSVEGQTGRELGLIIKEKERRSKK